MHVAHTTKTDMSVSESAYHHNSSKVRILPVSMTDGVTQVRAKSWYQCHHILKRQTGSEFLEEEFAHRCQDLNLGKMLVYNMSLHTVLHLPYSWKPGIKQQMTLNEHIFGGICRDIGVASTTKSVLLESVRKTTISVGLRQGHRSDLHDNCVLSGIHTSVLDSHHSPSFLPLLLHQNWRSNLHCVNLQKQTHVRWCDIRDCVLVCLFIITDKARSKGGVREKVSVLWKTKS